MIATAGGAQTTRSHIPRQRLTRLIEAMAEILRREGGQLLSVVGVV